MSDGTKIEWADATVNAVNGCSLASPGCTNCYAMRLAGTRMKHHPSRAGLTQESKAGPVWTGEVRLHEPALLQPLRWKRPRRIFWNAHGDLFHDNVPDEWIDRVFAVCALTPQHTHMILTKRSKRMREYCRAMAGGERSVIHAGKGLAEPGVLADRMSKLAAANPACSHTGPLPNVWLGVSVEDQARADERIPDLLATPAAVRWLSCEPLLGPVDLTIYQAAKERLVEALTGYWQDSTVQQADGSFIGIDSHYGAGPKLDWIVAGGESGPGARPMHPDWARSLRDQCEAADVPFHFKQWGAWELALDRERQDPDWRADYSNQYADRGKFRWLNLEGGRGFHGERFVVMRQAGKKATGRTLDGVEHDGVPAHG